MLPTKTAFKNSIKTLLQKCLNDNKDMDYFGEELGRIIYECIASAEVAEGILVSTAGSAASQTGATTSTGTIIVPPEL